MLKDFRVFLCRLILCGKSVAVWFSSFLDVFSPAENRQSGFFHHASDFEEVRILQRNSDFVSLFMFVVFGDSKEIANLWSFRLVLGAIKADCLRTPIPSRLCWVPVPGWESSVRTRDQFFSPLGERRSCRSDFQSSLKVEARGELLFPLILLAVLVRHLVFHAWDGRRQTHKDQGQFRAWTYLERALAPVQIQRLKECLFHRILRCLWAELILLWRRLRFFLHRNDVLYFRSRNRALDLHNDFKRTVLCRLLQMDELVGAESDLSLANKLLIHIFAAANVNFAGGCVQNDFPVTPDEILSFFLSDHDVSPFCFEEIILKRLLFGSIFRPFFGDACPNIDWCPWPWCFF